MSPRIAFIGFGEAGQAMAAGLREEGVADISAWDILFAEPAGAKLLDAARASGVRAASSNAEALNEADIVIAAVTAASSLEAAQECAPHLRGLPYYLDVNSVSPGRKLAADQVLQRSARYVDVAIVSAIHPARHRSPMMLAGPHAAECEPMLQSLNMRTEIVGDRVGAAAAIKMIRSVMIKGIEALTAECFVAALRAGVFDQVASSLKNNYPSIDWAKLAEYNLERMVSHGIRRAAEMQESAATLRELGVTPLMTERTVERQQELGEIGRIPDVKAAVTKGRAALLQSVDRALPRNSSHDAANAGAGCKGPQ